MSAGLCPTFFRKHFVLFDRSNVFIKFYLSVELLAKVKEILGQSESSSFVSNVPILYTWKHQEDPKSLQNCPKIRLLAF